MVKRRRVPRIADDVFRANEIIHPTESRRLPDLLDICLQWKMRNGPPRSTGKAETAGPSGAPLSGGRRKPPPLVTERFVPATLHQLSAFADARLELGRQP